MLVAPLAAPSVRTARAHDKKGTAMLKRLALVAGALFFGWKYLKPVVLRPALPPGAFMLFDGSSLVDWELEGNANWTLSDGIVQATSGSGYLVSRNSYYHFELRGEFWIEANSNSGILIRALERNNISESGAYEVNFNDSHPDPGYGTGAIVGLAQVSVPVSAAGRWNSFDIQAKGRDLKVFINGVQTAAATDDRYPRGYIALQRHAGTVKFRNIHIRPL